MLVHVHTYNTQGMTAVKVSKTWGFLCHSSFFPFFLYPLHSFCILEYRRGEEAAEEAAKEATDFHLVRVYTRSQSILSHHFSKNSLLPHAPQSGMNECSHVLTASSGSISLSPDSHCGAFRLSCPNAPAYPA